MSESEQKKPLSILDTTAWNWSVQDIETYLKQRCFPERRNVQKDFRHLYNNNIHHLYSDMRQVYNEIALPCLCVISPGWSELI